VTTVASGFHHFAVNQLTLQKLSFTWNVLGLRTASEWRQIE